MELTENTTGSCSSKDGEETQGWPEERRAAEYFGPTEETPRLLQFRDLCNKLAQTNFSLASNPLSFLLSLVPR